MLISCRDVPKKVHCSVLSLPDLPTHELQLAISEFDTYRQGNRNRPRRRERAGKKRLKKLDKRGGLREEVRHCSFGYFLRLTFKSSVLVNEFREAQ